jgi:hypothetical protein
MMASLSLNARTASYVVYWVVFGGITLLGVFTIIKVMVAGKMHPAAYNVINILLTVMVTQLVFILFLFGEDLIRSTVAGVRMASSEEGNYLPSRRKFVTQLGLVVAAIPFSSMVYGIFRQATHLFEHLAYPPFALPVAVRSGRVEEVDLTPQDSPQRLAGPLFVYRKIEGLRHVPKRRASDAQRRDRESRTVQDPPRSGVDDSVLHHSSRPGATRPLPPDAPRPLCPPAPSPRSCYPEAPP